MRGLRGALGAGLIAMVLSSSGCKMSRRSRVTTVEEESGALKSSLVMADASSAIQLIRGFHELDKDGWRWTMGEFSVTLLAPAKAAQNGAVLAVKLTYPETAFSRKGPTTLSASLDGLALEPQTVNSAGSFVYLREIPASAFTGEAVTIEFRMDKFLASGEVEERELGLIATSFELTAK